MRFFRARSNSASSVVTYVKVSVRVSVQKLHQSWSAERYWFEGNGERTYVHEEKRLKKSTKTTRTQAITWIIVGCMRYLPFVRELPSVWTLLPSLWQVGNFAQPFVFQRSELPLSPVMLVPVGKDRKNTVRLSSVQNKFVYIPSHVRPISVWKQPTRRNSSWFLTHRL